MSQYLSFKLINKNNPELSVDLGYWCTSIARTIGREFNGIFQYTEINVKLDYKTLESYIDTLQDGINEYKNNLRNVQEKKKEQLELLLNAQTEIALESIKEEISYLDSSIEAWKDDIDTWEMVEKKLSFILDTLGDNKEEWELVYKNS
jgi:hypothetical protein